MKKLTFSVGIKSGVGRHVELGIPGRRILVAAPLDWPDQLQPGSLNIGIHEDGYPRELTDNPNFSGVKLFDQGLFPPAFLILRDDMRNNKLRARLEMPDRGTAQVWRAVLCVEGVTDPYPAWVLRRLGSRVGEQLELVSDVHLKDTLSLENGMNVTVILEYEEGS